MTDSPQRDRLTSIVYMPKDLNQQMARLDRAFKLTKKAEVIDKRIRKAVHEKKLERIKGWPLVEKALAKGIITPDEKNIMAEAEKARIDAIQVDDFSQEEFLGHKPTDDSPTMHGPKLTEVKLAQ